MIKLGARVKDIYTGFAGVAVGRTEWLYGCARIQIESTHLDKDGKLIDAVWFDEQRVKVIKDDAIKDSGESEAPVGGPMTNPARSADPIR